MRRLPCNMLPGIFAVDFGGVNAGVLSCYLDALSFAVAAAFLSVLRLVIDGSWGWSGAFAIMAAICLLASGLTPYFLLQLERWKLAGGGKPTTGSSEAGSYGGDVRRGDYALLPEVDAGGLIDDSAASTSQYPAAKDTGGHIGGSDSDGSHSKKPAKPLPVKGRHAP